MANPSISELQNKEKFELIAELSHAEIKEFVIKQLTGNGKIIRSFMIYQFLMTVVGMFFIIRSVFLAFQQYPQPLFFTLGAAVFCFTVLVVFHELIHGMALKFTGAKKIHFGGYLKKFIFYAEADQQVFNRKQFAVIALAPLLVVKIATLAGAVFTVNQPVFYAFILVMSAHSLFCAGDIGLLSIFYKNENEEIYTFDVKAEKKSYYFKKLKSHS